MTQVDAEPIDYSKCPLHGESMRLYFEHHIETGSGLRAVLSNQLDAVVRCDEETVRRLPAIYRWLYNYAPREAWGSEEKVRTWLAALRV